MGNLNEQSMHKMESELETVDIQDRVYEAVKVIRKTSNSTAELVLKIFAGSIQDSKKCAGCRELLGGIRVR